MKLSNLRNVTFIVGPDKHRPHHGVMRITATVTVTTGVWPFLKSVDRPLVRRDTGWKFDDAIAEYPPQTQIERLWNEFHNQATSKERLCKHF